jgi:hypothetical protein
MTPARRAGASMVVIVRLFMFFVILLVGECPARDNI